MRKGSLLHPDLLSQAQPLSSSLLNNLLDRQSSNLQPFTTLLLLLSTLQFIELHIVFQLENPLNILFYQIPAINLPSISHVEQTLSRQPFLYKGVLSPNLLFTRAFLSNPLLINPSLAKPSSTTPTTLIFKFFNLDKKTFPTLTTVEMAQDNSDYEQLGMEEALDDGPSSDDSPASSSRFGTSPGDSPASSSGNASEDSSDSFHSSQYSGDSEDSWHEADMSSPEEMETDQQEVPFLLNIMTDHLLLKIFKRLKTRNTIHAFGQTNRRLRKLYTEHKTKIYVSFINRVYSPLCSRLFLLSRSTSMPSATRIFLNNTALGSDLRNMAIYIRKYAKSSGSEYAEMVANTFPYWHHPNPQFWTNKLFFRGQNESLLDYRGCFGLWLVLCIGFWCRFQKLVPEFQGQPEDGRSKPSFFLYKADDKRYRFRGFEKTYELEGPECGGCRIRVTADDREVATGGFREVPTQLQGVEEFADKVCRWHVAEDEGFIENFQSWNGSLHLLPAVDRNPFESHGLTTLFDAYLCYLYFYAKAATPHPIFYQPTIQHWHGCLIIHSYKGNQEPCTLCRIWEETYVPKGGLHFFDYTISETWTRLEAPAIEFIEKRMGVSRRYPFRYPYPRKQEARNDTDPAQPAAPLSQLDYLRDLSQFAFQSGISLELDESGRLAKMEEIKTGYFSDANMAFRNFDRYDWNVWVADGKKKKKSIVIKRMENACILALWAFLVFFHWHHWRNHRNFRQQTGP